MAKKKNGKLKKKKKFYCEVKGVVYMLTIKYLHMNRCVYATQSSLATSSLIVSTLQCRLMKYRKRKWVAYCINSLLVVTYKFFSLLGATRFI